MGGWLGGWGEKLRLKLVEVEAEAELGNNLGP